MMTKEESTPAEDTVDIWLVAVLRSDKRWKGNELDVKFHTRCNNMQRNDMQIKTFCILQVCAVLFKIWRHFCLNFTEEFNSRYVFLIDFFLH